MKQKSWTTLFLIITLMATSSLWAGDQAPITTTRDYTIGPGDILDISVWDNEALTRLVTVLPDGKIRFPLIGEVVVGGKTLADLEKELKQRIGTFVPAPDLTVMVQQVNSMLIYVIGRVNSPGRFALNTNIKVLQALTMAGGLNPFANRNKIKIFRDENGKTDIFQFEYDEVTEGKNLEQNIEIKRGDVVFVP